MSMIRLPLHAERGPSVARAGALSGAMTVNLLVLGALLLPAAIDQTLKGPVPLRPELQVIPLTIEQAIESVLPTPPSPPPPAPPVLRQPAPPTPVATPVEVPVEHPVTVAVTTPAVAVPPVASQPPTPPSAPAAAASDALAYIVAPQPDYPLIARRKGWEGTVVLRVEVDAEGLPTAVTVERSSGRPALDQAARRKVLADWRFRPALRDGLAVPSVGLVPVDFRLPRG
jgi:protein TonB